MRTKRFGELTKGDEIYWKGADDDKAIVISTHTSEEGKVTAFMLSTRDRDNVVSRFPLTWGNNAVVNVYDKEEG